MADSSRFSMKTSVRPVANLAPAPAAIRETPLPGNAAAFDDVPKFPRRPRVTPVHHEKGTCVWAGTRRTRRRFQYDSSVAVCARRGRGVLLPPVPLLGGDKDSALVVALARRLARAGSRRVPLRQPRRRRGRGHASWMRGRRSGFSALMRLRTSPIEGRRQKPDTNSGTPRRRRRAGGDQRVSAARAGSSGSRIRGAKSMLRCPARSASQAIRVRGNGGDRRHARGRLTPPLRGGRARLRGVRGGLRRGGGVGAQAASAAACGGRGRRRPRLVRVLRDPGRARRGVHGGAGGGVVRGIFRLRRSLVGSPTSPPPTAVVRRRGATRRALPSPRALPGRLPDVRMSENEDTDDSGTALRSAAHRSAVPERTRRDAALPRGTDLDGGGSDLPERRDTPAGGWRRPSTSIRIRGLRPRVRSARCARVHAPPRRGPPGDGPLAAEARARNCAPETSLRRVSRSSSPLLRTSRQRRNRISPDAPSSDDGQSSVGAYGDASGGFETWEAWEEEKRRVGQDGQPGAHARGEPRVHSRGKPPATPRRRSVRAPRTTTASRLDEPVDESS